MEEEGENVKSCVSQKHETVKEEQYFASLLNQIGQNLVKRVLPIWLIHHRFRLMGRKERADAIIREDRERAHIREERSRAHVARSCDPGFSGHAPDVAMGIIMAQNEENVEQNEVFGAAGGQEVQEFIPQPLLPRLGEDSIIPVSSKLLRFYANARNEEKFIPHVFYEEPEVVTKGVDFIIEKLLCSVCREISIDKIYGCIKGHQLCLHCHTQLMDRPAHYPRLEANHRSCPVCRETVHLCYVMTELENIVAILDFKCLYSRYGDGCNKILLGSQFTNHVKKECVVRPWKCPFCPNLVFLNTVKNHLMQNHRHDFLGFAKADDTQTTIGIVQLPVPMLGETTQIAYGLFYHQKWNKIFVLYQLKTGLIEYFWFICIIGTEIEAEKYTADFVLQSRYDMGYYSQRENRRKEWKGMRVMSVQNDVGDMVEEIGMSYKSEEVPLHDFSYQMSVGRNAHRVEGHLIIHIKKLNNQVDERQEQHQLQN